VTTVTATLGGVSAQATVTILADAQYPDGTATWTAGAVAAGVTRKQVVKSTLGAPNGGGLFAISGGSSATVIEALSTDGRQLWQAQLDAVSTTAMPDPFGGLLLPLNVGCDLQNPMRLVDIDGTTGQVAWEYVGTSTCTSDPPQIALGRDGTVVVATKGNMSGFPELMVLDGRNGQVIQAPAIPPSYFTDITGQRLAGYSRIGAPMVDPTGVTYVAYEQREVAYPPRVVNANVWLMKIDPDRTITNIQLASTMENWNLFPGRIIPDGYGGVIATWIVDPAAPPAVPNPFRAAHVTATGVVTPYDLPLPTQGLIRSPTLVDVALVLDQSADGAFAAYGSTLTAFTVASGAPRWTYTATQPLTVLAADDAGGVVVKVDGSGEDSLMRFDSTGAVTTLPWSGSGRDYLAGHLWFGMTGDTLTFHWAEPITVATSGWFSPDQQGTSRATQLVKVTDPSSTGPNQDAITGVLTLLRTELDRDPEYVPVMGLVAVKPSCSNWLSGGQWQPNGQSTVSLVLASMLAGVNYGHGHVTPRSVIAFAGSANGDTRKTPTSTNPNFAITVNDDGTFFTDGAISSRALTLLHETAHVMHAPEFQADAGNDAAVRENDALVMTMCGYLMSALETRITSIAPSSGPIGTSVTITGVHFGLLPTDGTVTFGNVVALPTSWTDTTIVVPVPSGATTGQVVVHRPGLDSNGKKFTVTMQ